MSKFLLSLFGAGCLYLLAYNIPGLDSWAYQGQGPEGFRSANPNVKGSPAWRMARGLEPVEPPASQLTPVDVSLEPSRVCAAPGETATVYVVVSAAKSTPLGTVEALFEYDGLKLVGVKGVGCWAVDGFLNDPDGINDDIYDGEAFFTLLGAMTDDQRMFATPCGTRVMALTFVGDGEVRLVGPSGYADTRVYLPQPPNVNVTRDNTDVTTVCVDGLRRVKARRLGD